MAREAALRAWSEKVVDGGDASLAGLASRLFERPLDGAASIADALPPPAARRFRRADDVGAGGPGVPPRSTAARPHMRGLLRMPPRGAVVPGRAVVRMSGALRRPGEGGVRWHLRQHKGAPASFR